MASRFQQGKFTPTNPHKYTGDLNKIRYMSSYEFETHKFLDTNSHILLWSSECIPIKYMKPTDHRIHTYFPDYWVEYVNKQGEIKRMLVEVKPASQAAPPRGGRNRKNLLYEQLQFAVNKAKWNAAIVWCAERSKVDSIPIEFKIITERSIFT